MILDLPSVINFNNICVQKPRSDPRAHRTWEERLSNKSGISSLELAVVLALIGIMAVITVPYLGSWLQHYRLVGAARQVASTLQEARLRAVSDNLEWRVVINRDTDTYWLQRGNAANGSRSWTNQGGTLSLPRGVRFTGRTGNDIGGQVNIQFNPNGTSGVGSIFILGQDGGRYYITVLPTTGRVRIRKG